MSDRSLTTFILIPLVTTFLLLSNISPLYAQRSIFRAVGEKKDQRLKTEDQREPSPEKSNTPTKALLDPRSLLGERPKTLAQAVQIPPEYGRISETHEGNPRPLIIHIQDVHVHYEAQKNLSNILDKLVKENGLRLILVEGGSGDTSLSFLRAEATKEKRLEVAEKYLKLGKISGEEYLDIISDKPITLWGVEDEALYDKNLDIFFKVDAFKEKALTVAQALKTITTELKAPIYSPALKELEQKKADYEEGKSEAVVYYQYLGGVAEAQTVDLSRYPNFKNFLGASKLEKHIDFQKVDGQHQSLVGKLTQALSKEELTLLAEKGLKYKLNEAGPGEYYGFLKEVLKKSDPAPGTHQDLDLYIEYVLLYADRDHIELFREGKTLEKEIKGRLYTSDDEKTLSEISDHLELLLNFLELNLSPDDLKDFQADRQSFLVKGWKKFLLDRMEEHRVKSHFPTDISILDNNLELLESFYELGMKRDSALVKNSLSKIEEEKVDLAVVIAGGFHTAQIIRLLQEQNYSYMVIAPKITQASDLELYHRILKEKAKPEAPADDNLRQSPTAFDGSLRKRIADDLEEAAAKDGGIGELTLISDVKSLVEGKKSALLVEEGVMELEDRVNQLVLPIVKEDNRRRENILDIQLEQEDSAYYAGGVIGTLEEGGNTIRRFNLVPNVVGLTRLREELRETNYPLIFLPMHHTVLLETVESVLREEERAASVILYKSPKVQSQFNVIVPYGTKVLTRVKDGIKIHASQMERLPYDQIKDHMDQANARELGLRRRGYTHAERFRGWILRNGIVAPIEEAEKVFREDEREVNRELIEELKKDTLWDANRFRAHRRKGTKNLQYWAHPDDPENMAGALTDQWVANGMPIHRFYLATGSGADVKEVAERDLTPGGKRYETALIRKGEEEKGSQRLGIESTQIGFNILKEHKKELLDGKSEEELKTLDQTVVRRSGDQIYNLTIVELDRDPNVKDYVVHTNWRDDPNERHRQVFEEVFPRLERISRERPNLIFRGFEATFEGERYNAFFQFTRRKRPAERRGAPRDIMNKLDASHHLAIALARPAGELVVRKGSYPIPLERVEAFQIIPYDFRTASDGGYKGIPLSELKPTRDPVTGKPLLTESFSGVRYTRFGLGPGIDDKGKVLTNFYGYHYASFVAERSGKKKIKLLVIHDPRPTGKAIRDAQVTGFFEAGREKGFEVEVVDLGILTTPLAEHALRHLQADGGVIITASHNPLEHNGWKYLDAKGRGALLLATDMNRLIKEVARSYQTLRTAFLKRFDEVQIPSYRPDEEARQAVIQSYIQFAKETFGLKEPLREKIVLDPNGGAATGVNKTVAEALGMEVHEIESELGKPSLKIEPLVFEKGEKTPRYRRLQKEMEAFGASVGVMTDFDADRGELGFGGQETSAFNVAMMLSDYDLEGKLNVEKKAIVVIDGTSSRIRDIAKAFGVDVLEVETGEINIISKMKALRQEGYVVPLGVEGTNGGTVFGESTSRDGLFTGILAAKVLNNPQIYFHWLERSGQEVNPQSKVYIEDGKYTLENVMASLPRYYSPLYDFSNFSLDHRAFKQEIERRFSERFTETGEEGIYVFQVQPFSAAYSRDYVKSKVEYFDGTEIHEHVTGDGLGGFRITLVDVYGNRSFIWMRGSRTEPQKMRYGVDTKFPEEVAPLEDLLRSLEIERLGIIGRDESGEYYVRADGTRIKTTEDLSTIAKDGGKQLASARDGGDRIARVEKIITALEQLAGEEKSLRRQPKSDATRERLNDIKDERKKLFKEAIRLVDAEERDAKDIDDLREIGSLRIQLANARDGLTAKDGASKILGDPALVTIAEGAEVGEEVVFDVRGTGKQIFVAPGAKVTGRTVLKATKENSVIIKPYAQVDSSYLEGVSVGQKTEVRRAHIEGEVFIGDHARVFHHAVIKAGKGRVRLGNYVTVFPNTQIESKTREVIVGSGSEKNRTEVSGILIDFETGTSSKFYFNPTVVRSRFGDYAHAEGATTKIKDSQFGHYAHLINVNEDGDRGGHFVRLVDVRQSLNNVFGNLVDLERVSEIRNEVISSMTVPMKLAEGQVAPRIYPVVVKNANQVNMGLLFGGVNLVGVSFIHEGVIDSFVHSGPAEQEHTIFVGTPFDPSLAPHYSYLGNLNSYGVTVRKKTPEGWQYFEWEDPDIFESYEAAYKHIFLGAPLPENLDVEFGRNNYGAFTSTSDYDPTSGAKGSVVALGANIFTGIFSALQVPLSIQNNTLLANQTFIGGKVIPAGSLVIGGRTAVKGGQASPEGRIIPDFFGVEKGSGVQSSSLVEKERIEAVLRLFKTNLAYGRAALYGAEHAYGIEKLAWLRAAKIVLENSRAVQGRSLTQYLDGLEPILQRLEKEIAKIEEELGEIHAQESIAFLQGKSVEPYKEPIAKLEKNRSAKQDALESQRNLLREKDAILAQAEALLGTFEKELETVRATINEEEIFKGTFEVESSSLLPSQGDREVAEVVLLKQQKGSLEGGNFAFPKAIKLPNAWHREIATRTGAVSAKDGAEKYVAKDEEWLETHEPLHLRPASKDLRNESRKLQDEGKAKLILLPSAMLEEDMGESLAAALDHLAEETKNDPFNNQTGSVFKVVLLIEDPQVKFEDVDAYLEKHHLSHEQFYDVVTHDQLEDYDTLVRLEKYQKDPALLYRIKVETFLRINLLEDGFNLAEGPNLVIVAPTSQADDWNRYSNARPNEFLDGKFNVQMVTYVPRREGETSLNLAPLLMMTAVESLGADPEEALQDLTPYLTILDGEINVSPKPVTPEYFKAYEIYRRQV